MKACNFLPKYILFLCISITSLSLYADAGVSDDTGPQPDHSGQQQKQQEKKRDTSSLVNTLKTAVAWGLVPLSSEIALNISKDYLKQNYSFLAQVLDIHAENIRRSTSQHLTDNLSARLESFSYKTLSDEHEKKQTDDLQTELLFRSLFSFSILSMNAQKARKTYFRLQDILDNIAASARLALIDGDQDQAGAMIALAAQTMIYIHPEIKASDGTESIRTHFNHHLDWATMPEFRTGIHRHLRTMDPLVRRSTLINLRYCDLLNQWQISYQNCSAYEKGAIAELEGMAEMTDSETQPGIIKSALRGIPEQHIRNSIFIMGVSVPAVFLYFLNKKESPIIYTVVNHFAKVTGMATTKSTIERFASNTRRSLENWGAIDTGKGSSTSPAGEFANDYFNTLQKNATAILAEQPNFARSNAQRALEALIINLAEVFSLQRLNDNQTSAGIIAATLVQNYRENVEVTSEDSLTRSTLIAYRPLHNPQLIPEVIKALEVLEPAYRKKKKVRQWYQQQLKAWLRLSAADIAEQDLPEFPDMPWISQIPEPPSDDCRNLPGGCPPSSWYQAYLPDKESVSTAAIHGTALSYSILIAILEPLTTDQLRAGQPTYWNLVSYYLLTSMFRFGLRSLGEPAIVHLQTVIKNWIGSTTGILSPEDKQIQDELINKVNAINRKLSIEAQTSRSYRATLEALLARYWSLSNHLLIHPGRYPLSQPAAVLALATYTQRYFHSEFTEDNLVMKTLALTRLKPGFEQLRERGEMADFSRHVLATLRVLDPSFDKPEIRQIYLKMLKSWGLKHGLQIIAESEDVLDTWASYGDYLLGAAGFSTQAMVKALFHGNEVISRSLANFFVNIFEYGTTDSLRKKIYAWSRLKMLNIVPFYPETEMIGANFANQELTDSFRRQKFYFGKPELDMRTQLIQIITSIANNYYQAILLINPDHLNNGTIDRETLDNVEHLVALTVLRLVLFAPDIAADDLYILQSIQILSLPIQDELLAIREPVLIKVKALLDSLDFDDKSLIEDAMNRATLMINHWLQPPVN